MDRLKEHLSRLSEEDVDLGLEGMMESLSKMRHELNKFRIEQPAQEEE